MDRKKSFTVTPPPMLIWLALTLVSLVLVVMIITTLSSGTLEIAMVVAFTIVVLIPCGLIILWVLMFRIKVDGTTISVRRFFGIVNFCFDVSEITMVKCKTVQNQMGRNQKITLYTSKGKKIPVETLMVNSEEMIRFIERNVDEAKFERSFKTF